MPQLDPSSFSSQLFWLTVSFAVLYLVLARFLLPRVGQVLATRAHALEADLHEATRMKAEAQSAQQAYELALSEARAKSQTMLSVAQDALNARSAVQSAALRKTIEEKLASADGSIFKAKQDALAKISPVAGELAALIVEALVHHKPTPQQIGAAISEIAKERTL